MVIININSFTQVREMCKEWEDGDKIRIEDKKIFEGHYPIYLRQKDNGKVDGWGQMKYFHISIERSSDIIFDYQEEKIKRLKNILK